MSYYSDVALTLTAKGYKSFMERIDALAEPLKEEVLAILTGSDVSLQHTVTEHRLLIWYSTRWYDDDDAIRAIDKALGKLDDEDYYLVHVGEEYSDITYSGGAFAPFNVEVSRKLTYNNNECIITPANNSDNAPTTGSMTSILNKAVCEYFSKLGTAEVHATESGMTITISHKNDVVTHKIKLHTTSTSLTQIYRILTKMVASELAGTYHYNNNEDKKYIYDICKINANIRERGTGTVNPLINRWQIAEKRYVHISTEEDIDKSITDIKNIENYIDEHVTSCDVDSVSVTKLSDTRSAWNISTSHNNNRYKRAFTFITSYRYDTVIPLLISYCNNYAYLSDLLVDTTTMRKECGINLFYAYFLSNGSKWFRSQMAAYPYKISD